MKKTLVAAALLSLAGPALAAEAAALYGNKCTACHGKDGKGTSVGKKMGAPDLTTLKISDADIASTHRERQGQDDAPSRASSRPRRSRRSRST